MAQEEEHVRRIWVEVSALRRSNAERFTPQSVLDTSLSVSHTSLGVPYTSKSVSYTFPTVSDTLQVVAQEEEHVRRIWVEVGALRRTNAERFGEMEDKVNSAHPSRFYLA